MTNRRQFLKITGTAGLTFPWHRVPAAFAELNETIRFDEMKPTQDKTSLIGPYGIWAASLADNIPALSFRNERFTKIDEWRKVAKQQVIARLGIPDTGSAPQVKVNRRYSFDSLIIEELSWQLGYGRPTEAIFLRPEKTSVKLPGILAFHDHSANKYFGTQKITRTNRQHPLMVEHQKEYYEGRAWANEIAKRGYAVLVSDAFPFASRRVWLQDVPLHLREGLNDDNHDDPRNIQAYNEWAARHEHIMAKSLFSAGTTWPGVFFAEDKVALDILCARPEVDASKIGCAGLSGGGMRTAFMGGLDDRIKCAVCVGFMTTWKDFVLNKSYTHTWMTYVPMLPNELDFPEILALRAPLPTLVLNDQEDDLYTLQEMKRADDIMRAIYQKANAGDRYRCSFYPGPHKFDIKMQEEAFQFFHQALGIGD